MNIWKCILIFATETLQQKIKITGLKPFFGENTNNNRLVKLEFRGAQTC